MNKVKRVAILFGGKSVEHEVSVRSALNVASFLDKGLFETVLIGITKSGDWYLCNEVSKEIQSGVPVSIELKGNDAAFVAEGEKIDFDLVFPILHGTDGEDGSIQGLFKVLGKPVVGSAVLGSAVAMDKILSKKLLEHAGVPVVAYQHFTEDEKDKIDFGMLTEKLGLPFMIKSGNLGSSVGVSKVTDEKTFHEALEDSFRYSRHILIEKFVKGRELECGVIGNEKPASTWPGEIAFRKAYEFYTYEAKYQDAEAIEMVVPAPIDRDIQEKVRQYSEQAFKALACNDYARVDIFVSETGQVYVNEINTIPGFTNASMFPLLWKNMGLEYSELLTKLIETALQRWNNEKKLETHYDKA